MKTLIALLLFTSVNTLSAAQRHLVIPAVASIHGGNGTFFHSDLRVMNLSSAQPITVQLTYRCWSGKSCGSGSSTLTIAPRQNALLADLVAQRFGASESAGALELDYDDANGEIAVQSRLSSPASPAPTVGELVPAVDVAHAVGRSVLNLAAFSTDPTHGFRTNAGGFNPNDQPVDVTFELRSGSGALVGSTQRRWEPREAFQFPRPLDQVMLLADFDVEDAYVVVRATAPFIPYVSMVDNQSGDSTVLTSTPDPISSTVVVTLSRYRFTPGSAESGPIRIPAGKTTTLVFASVDGVHGLSAIPQLGIEARDDITPGDDYTITVTPDPSMAGSRFNFACTHVCGSGHGSMFGSLVVE